MKIEIATPISLLFRGDMAEKLCQASDCLECREETAELFFPKEELFHFHQSIVVPWNVLDKEYISTTLSKKKLKLVSFHIAAACTKPVLDGFMFLPGGDMLRREELCANVCANLEWLRSLACTKKLEISVENNNYYPTEAYEYITDGKFISEIVIDNNIGFLFDLAHAHVTAVNRRKNIYDYVEELPMARLSQIHVSRHGIRSDGIAWDAHHAPDEELYKEVTHFVEEYKPRYVTAEFYKDTTELLNIIRKLRDIVKEI